LSPQSKLGNWKGAGDTDVATSTHAREVGAQPAEQIEQEGRKTYQTVPITRTRGEGDHHFWTKLIYPNLNKRGLASRKQRTGSTESREFQGLLH
jgi:hypothetical protein